MSPDIAASVRARLLSQAHGQGEEFERTLVRFAAERWLFRLGASSARERCLLKGAALLTVWLPDPHRATRDIDLLAFGRVDDAAIRSLIAEVCAVSCPEDGVIYDLAELSTESIRAEEEYVGVRARFWAHLGKARIRMQIDFGVGDALPSDPEEILYPVLLRALPPAQVRAYPRTVSIAEKFEAMVKLDRANSRMKDFHDIFALSGAFHFDGSALREAVAACFERRGTPWTPERPLALTSAFYQDEDVRRRWQFYLRAGGILIPPPGPFEEIGERIVLFLGPVRDSIVAGSAFENDWAPERGWSRQGVEQ